MDTVSGHPDLGPRDSPSENTWPNSNKVRAWPPCPGTEYFLFKQTSEIFEIFYLQLS